MVVCCWVRVVVAVVARPLELTTVLVVAGAVLLLCLALLQQTAIELLYAGRECTATWCAERGQWRRLNQRVLLACQHSDGQEKWDEGGEGFKSGAYWLESCL